MFATSPFFRHTFFTTVPKHLCVCREREIKDGFPQLEGIHLFKSQRRLVSACMVTKHNNWTWNGIGYNNFNLKSQLSKITCSNDFSSFSVSASIELAIQKIERVHSFKVKLFLQSLGVVPLFQSGLLFFRLRSVWYLVLPFYVVHPDPRSTWWKLIQHRDHQ